MNISKIIKKIFKSCLILLLALIFFLSNFQLGFFGQLTERWRDREVVDNLYLARQDKNVVDNFIPIAKAAPGTRVRTVEFFAGQDAGSATNDNQNQQQNFTAQSFSLAESSDIIDAYVEVSAQIGATTTSGVTYASAFIYFDACTSPCTPSPSAFTTTAGLGTTSGESQTIRFRASVTSEGDIAAYAGGGVTKSFQVGYCFGTGSTCSGTTAANIQGANAKLVITYTYEDTSSTQTNTVIYPLESASGVGSKTAVQAACTVDSNCPAFSYNAEIPEVSTQLSQWFYLQTSINANLTNDWQTVSDIGGNPGGANTPIVYFEEALSTNGGWVNVLRSGVAGYANNTAQSLEFSTVNASAYVMGGENYITYTYPNSASPKTKTVVFPVGEVITAAASTAKSALTGSTVYFPESGVTVKKVWFRIHTSKGGSGTAGTLAITTKVGNNTETGQTSYSFATDSMGVSDDGYFIHLIPSADYAELQAATASAGKAVQMTAQWTVSAGGAVSAELVITYTYTSDSSGYLVTQNLFAGQQTVAPSATFSTPNNSINPAIPETTGTVTIRGASLRSAAKGAAYAAANEAMGSNLTTSSCSSSNTSTAVSDNELSRFAFWKNLTSVVTNNDATTYTACYSTAENSVKGGILIVTYQWDAPPSNQPPTVLSVSIDSGAEFIDLNPGGTQEVVCFGTVQDLDGYENITSVEAKLYRTSIGHGASDDKNNHYTLSGDSQCAPSNGLDYTEDYTCTFSVYYFADGTDDASAYEGDNWTCRMMPSDGEGEGTAGTDTIEMRTLLALEVDVSEINYGEMEPETNTGLNNQVVNITNIGNVRIDVGFDGYGAGDGDGFAMVCVTGNIPITNEKYDMSNVTYDSLTWQLTDAAIERDWDVLQRINEANPVQDEDKKYSYWGLAVSTGTKGLCSGTVNFTANNDAGAD